ncbi:MAG: PEP-CTERM sorting domain-containing protein [Rubrivivax sp.]|nr:PEP-CTERM sorting domain-containing protein [Rubrivivax sp.]
MRSRRWVRTSIAMAAALLAAPMAVQAASKVWACSNSYWDYEDCWSPFGLPGPADDAYVDVVGGVDTVLRYDELSDAQTVRYLVIDASRFGPTVTFEQSGGSLSTTNVKVGQGERGAYRQTGGSHTVAQSLVLASYSSYGSGSYLLQGGSLKTGITDIGQTGIGTFEQTGGTHATGSLYLGGNLQGSPASGYRLSGGSLQVTGTAAVRSGSVFEHLGGTVKLQDLEVGNHGGAYVMLGNSSLQAKSIRITSAFGGMVQQQAGTISTIELLIAGNQGGGGSFEQYGGSLSSALTVVGDAGVGRMYQGAGEHATTELVLGRRAGSYGEVQLQGGLLSSQTTDVGREGAALLWITGGTHRVEGGMSISSQGTYRLAGTGLLDVAGSAVAVNHGTFEHQGGRLQGTLENRGSFVHGGVDGNAPDFAGRLVNHGSVVLNGDTRFGNGLRNEVDLDLLPTGRTLTLDGQGLENNGSFALRGGTLTGSGQLTNYNSLSGHGRIAGDQFYNFGTLAQTGGTLALASTGGAFNYGRWSMEAQRDLNLDGSGVIFFNVGALALNGGRVTGNGQLANVGVISGSGQIMSRFQNDGTLGILQGEQVTVTSGFRNVGLIDLRGSGASLVLTSGQMVNQGLLAGNGRVFAKIDNQAGGRIQAEGGVLSFSEPIHNAGTMVAAAGGTLLLQLPLSSQTGTLQLDGGTIDTAGWSLRNDGIVSGHGTLRGTVIDNAGRMLFGAGNTQVFGSLNHLAGAQIVVSGTGVAHFNGSVQARAGSEIRVSADSAAVFFAAVSQANGAAFTGDGSFYFEGGLSVGDSPGAGGAEGNVVFGSANRYRAEIGGLSAGSGFDHFAVGDRLTLGGTLQLSWWGGFEAQAGQRFDLFDWGSVSGTFAAIDLSAAALDPGLRWDTSRLYLDGSVAVSAVPEPGSMAMLLGGLAVFGGLRRRLQGERS